MAQRKAPWCPHALDRTGDSWPIKTQFWFGWLSYVEFDIIENYHKHDVNSFKDLSRFCNTTDDNARKNIKAMLNAGLLEGDTSLYHLADIAKKLFDKTLLHILTTETGELMTTVVIGDIHAREAKFMQLMQQIGAADNDGNRMGGFKFIQLGDAISLGYGEQEADFYQWLMEEWFNEDDITLIGNHELPAIWHNNQLDFNGWAERDIIAEQLVKKYWKNGRLKCAASLSKDGVDYLFTHAGISPYQYDKIPNCKYMTPEDIAKWYNMEFYEKMETGNVKSYLTDPLVGVDAVLGGIFWNRPSEMAWAGYDLPFRQAFGHTPSGPMDLGEKFKDLMPNLAPNSIMLLDTKSVENLDMSNGRRPSREEFGGVACLVFEDGFPEPTLHCVEAG